MIEYKYRSNSMVIEISKNDLNKYDDRTMVLVPRGTVSSEIVNLQNASLKTEQTALKLIRLINIFYSQNKNNTLKKRFVKMSIKTVRECFEDNIYTIYIDI